jgi:hypothetical protein
MERRPSTSVAPVTAAPVEPDRRPRPKLFLGAALKGVLVDLVSTLLVSLTLTAALDVTNAAVLWTGSALTGVLAGWVVGRAARHHELFNAVVASVIAILTGVLLVGSPTQPGSMFDFAVIPPLYAMGAGLAIWRRRVEDDDPEHVRLREQIRQMDEMRGTVLGQASSASGAVWRAVLYGVVIVVVRLLFRVALQ